MIRIGSQVDLVVPLRPEMSIMVQPGDKVRAGETPLNRLILQERRDYED